MSAFTATGMSETEAWARASKTVSFVNAYSGGGSHFVTTPIWFSIWKERPYDYVQH